MRPYRSLLSLSVVALLMVSGIASAVDAPAPAPKLLFDPAAADAGKMITLNGGPESDITTTLAKDAINVTVVANSKSSFPGIVITPTSPWNLNGFGHVEAKVTNNGEKPLRLSLRIDNDGSWQDEPYSAGTVSLKPGQTSTISAIFGYKWGKKDYALKPEAVTKAIIFAGKADVEQKFTIAAIQAAGPAGEIPYVDPNTMAVKPAGGVMLGGPATFEAAKQVVAKGGAKVTASDSKSLTVAFTGQGEQSVLIKPVSGMWNLNEHLQVRMRVKNTGSTPLTPALRLESRAGASDIIPAAKPIAPGAEAEIAAPFMAALPWKGVDMPEMLDQNGPARGFNENAPGTGTKYASNTTTGITLLINKQAGALQITSILADMPPRQPLPEWLGKKPPVEGDWKLTFEDNFDGSAIDLKKWNIYSEGEWHLGKATAWSKDNVIVKDGKLFLRVEKRQAHHNDNPAYPLSQYATGNCDTYGKWTQRYGYFEARLKLPTTPDSFTAFWMMPDRGLAYASDTKPAFDEPRHFMRNSTNGLGMEFDIMEQLSIWGPNRHDFGMHWDHYMKNHKSTGVFTCYYQPDAEGYLTVGMLWTPGVVVMYQQGKEAARWETKRISSIPSYFILQHITGGWETEGMDDSKLPADMIFDYVRAWQRKDLASPADGYKPNDGGPLPPKKAETKAP